MSNKVYNKDALSIIRDDFYCTFREFEKACQKRNENIENIPFHKAYEIFLEIIVLKLEYKVSYTKLFVKKLLAMRWDKLKIALDIQSYFLEKDPAMLKEISQELLINLVY